MNFVVFLFILLFTYTAISKFSSLSAFYYNINRSPIIGQYSSWVKVLIPAIEVAIAILLFVPKTRFVGLCASLFLMSVFSLYVGYALFSDTKLPCSCGGVIESLSWHQHFWLNVMLTLLALLAIRLQVNYASKEPNVLLQ